MALTGPHNRVTLIMAGVLDTGATVKIQRDFQASQDISPDTPSHAEEQLPPKSTERPNTLH